MDIMTADHENRTLSDKFMLRLPDGMRARIKNAAFANGRSMNAEIISTLDEKYPALTATQALIHALVRKIERMPPEKRERAQAEITKLIYGEDD